MTYVATKIIQDALVAKLLTVPSLPQHFQENETAVQNDITAYCRSTLAPSKTTVASLGTNPIMMQTGLYAVDLIYEEGYGYAPMRLMADAVLAAFPTGFITLTSGDRLQIISAWTNPTLPNQGSFIMIPIRIEWRILK